MKVLRHQLAWGDNRIGNLNGSDEAIFSLNLIQSRNLIAKYYSLINFK